MIKYTNVVIVLSVFGNCGSNVFLTDRRTDRQTDKQTNRKTNMQD